MLWNQLKSHNKMSNFVLDIQDMLIITSDSLITSSFIMVIFS